MSVSLYQSGVSGLSAAQQQLATTSNNIANVNTEGYNRQRAEQNASMGLVTVVITLALVLMFKTLLAYMMNLHIKNKH